MVVAHVLGGKVERVCITSLAEAGRDRSRVGGRTSVVWNGNEGPLARQIYELAGYAAEELITGQSGRFQDYPEEWQGVRDHVQGLVNDWTDPTMSSLWEQARTHVRNHQSAVKAVAKELLIYHRLNEQQVKEVMGAAAGLGRGRGQQ